eukprot:4420722-Alexandrium_andersonii.AAC.1
MAQLRARGWCRWPGTWGRDQAARLRGQLRGSRRLPLVRCRTGAAFGRGAALGPGEGQAKRLRACQVAGRKE